MSRERPTTAEIGGLTYRCESCGAPEGTWCRTARGFGDWALHLHAPRTNAYWNTKVHLGPQGLHNAVHQAIYDLIVDHPMWIGNDGQGLEYSPERETRIGDFCDQLTAKLINSGLIRA